MEDRLALSTFSVVNTADNGDNLHPVAGSLRAAIVDANATINVDTTGDGIADPDVIAFSIGGGGVQTIAPLSALPTLTDPVTIDGTTQPGFGGSPLIELNGASAGFAHGLSITAGNSTVRSLVINRYSVDRAGVNLEGPGAVGNRVQGCYIGTDVSGTVPLGNFDGVRLRSGPKGNFIGTDGDGVNDLAERNIISGNIRLGVQIAFAGTDNNVVAGNYIGTDVNGTVALGNRQGAEMVLGARGNRIGTDGNGVADSAERNVISGNVGFGIRLSNDEANPVTTGNTVAGNYIGTQEDGESALGNGRSGITIFGGVQGNQIGGATAALGNIIAFNALPGVHIFNSGATGATGNRIQGNSIHSNIGLGIDLSDLATPDGVTANDPSDADSGPNNRQNTPDLGVAHAGPKTFVSGVLSSVPDSEFTLDFYASAVADPTGHGEGERYLGSRTFTTDGNGNAFFASLLDAPTIDNEVLTATATDADGNTSEFSFGIPVSDLIVSGTHGNDIFEFTAHSSGAVEVFRNFMSFGSAAKIDIFDLDSDSSDSYNINFGGWTGVITLNDLGATGTDVLTTFGTAGEDVIVKVGNDVTWGSPVTQTATYIGIENVVVDGGAGNDTITDPGSDTTILGGPGDDTIIIDATFGNGVVVDGGQGSDTYLILFGNLAGPVTVADSGATGSDSLTVQGTAGSDAFLLTGNQVQNGTETVVVASTITNLVMTGGGGADTTTIDGYTAPTTNLTVDGSGGTHGVTIVGSPPAGVNLDLVSAVQTVAIDVQRNSVNLASNGVITLALFTSTNFNAASVDVGSVLFAGTHAVQSSLQDADGDGDLDLVLHFRTQDTNLRALYEQFLTDDINEDGMLDSSRQQAAVSLSGRTVDNIFFAGFDELDVFLAGKSLREILADLAAAGAI